MPRSPSWHAPAAGPALRPARQSRAGAVGRLPPASVGGRQEDADHLIGNVALVPSTPVHDDADFEQWVEDQGGPEAVLSMIEDVRRQAADGSLRGFTDKDEFLAHLASRSRRSA